MGEPLISVVIPVYNVEKYITICIESVIQQVEDDKLIEIVLINDGSTDQSGELCKEFVNKYDYIKLVDQENKGLLQARRAGLKKARGNYIINLDSDDLLMPEAIKEIKKALAVSGADIIFFNISVLKGNEILPYYSNVFTDNYGSFITKEQVIHAFFTSREPVVTSMAGKVVKRSCFELNKDYSNYGKQSMGEDTLQTAEVVSHANIFYYLNKNLYIYRLGTGMTSKFDHEYYVKFKTIIKDVLQYKDFNETYRTDKDLNNKILAIGCRAITQSKCIKDMSYRERKNFIASIMKDKDFIKAIESCDLKNSLLTKKYKWIIILLRLRAYLLIHLALKVV